MNNPETQSALCAQCPNRNLVSRKLAEFGIVRASQDCDGPDTINRYDIAGSSATETGGTVVSLLPELVGSTPQCPRDDIKLKRGQVLLGTSQDDPKTHFVGTGESHYLELMQAAVAELGDTAVNSGAQIHYPKPSKYYRSKNLAHFQRYMIKQGIIKPVTRKFRSI